jgi:phospholipid/cholesterol/gamma-HCH transport system ATP-binding protein
VLFDEPTAGQDPIRKNAILSMIAHYRKKFGFTAVLVSHDIPDVFFISDRIILLWEGRIAFQGSYEESSRLDHPMAEEFLRSLEGLQDELTGLLSKQMFKAKYAMTLNQTQAKQTATAVLFSVELDLLTETLGPLAAAEVLKALGKYINTNLGALEGFSVRNHTGQILAILPYTDLQEAQQLVDNLGNGLQKEALSNIQALTQAKIGASTCFEIYIYAGISEANSNDDIDNIIERARATQKIIGTFRCDPKGERI